jgi:hypothetical protein
MSVVEIRIITDNFAKALGAMSHSLIWDQVDEVSFKLSTKTPGVVLVRFKLRADKAADPVRPEFATESTG